ncbi:CBL-interacting serine threonine-protein kinase 11, partial [Musa troglodytarum]
RRRSFSASTSWAAFWAAAPPPKSTTRATSPPAAAWPSRSSRNPAGPPAPVPPPPRTPSSARSPPSASSATRTSSASTRCSPPAPVSSPPSPTPTPAASSTGTSSPRTSSWTTVGTSRSPTSGGTPAYVAPEILLSSKGTTGYDGAKADIWSCGVILFVLNAGYLPFNDRNLMSLYRKIHSGHHRCPRWTPPDLRRLISRLLDPNPATRVSVDGILRDPWFARGVDPEQLATMMRPRGSDAGLDDKPHRRRGGELNAFDLISFASGLDLSGLFVDAASDRQRFASVEPVDRILDRVEEVGKGEGLVVTREVEKGSAAVIDGRNGEFVLMLQVYQLTGGTSVVEVEVGGGAIGSFWNETLRPVLSGPLHLGGLG